jgi:3-hydroxyisobutyrate dehydrogenase-like beta-hydroxyacid dehydrogenase
MTSFAVLGNQYAARAGKLTVLAAAEAAVRDRVRCRVREACVAKV